MKEVKVIKPQTIDAKRYLIQLREELIVRKLSLRQEANQCAKKVRELDLIINDEMREEVRLQDLSDSAWTVKSFDQMKLDHSMSKDIYNLSK